MIKTLEQISKLGINEQRAWCAGNFFDFCRYALGYSDMNGEHEEVCLVLQFDEYRSKMILMPRNTFKSSVISCGWSLFSLMKEPDMRILLYSDSANKAEGFLRDIKNHIEGKAKNSKFRELYGEWETSARKGKWTDSEILVSVRKSSRKEPSISTAGIETSRVGFHYDMIIFDDIVTDLNTTTKAQMDKVFDCYKKSLSLLKPGGNIVIVGTRWAFGDAHGRIIDENADNPTFRIIVKKAFEFKNGQKAYKFADCGEESLTPDFLDDKKKKLGTQLFSCLYLNNPASDESAVFQADNFSFYSSVSSDILYKTCTVDPAGEGEDFTAITVVGFDHSKRMYVLDLVNAHLKPNQIVDNIIKLSYKWKFVKLGVEVNIFKGMLQDAIKDAVAKERRNPNFSDFSIEEFNSSCKRGEGKHARILSLQPMHERRELFLKGIGTGYKHSLESLPSPWCDLVNQMIQYTYDGAKSPHDDLIDALSFQMKLARMGGVIEKEDFPKGSLAWYEEKEMDEISRMNRRMPRVVRKRYNQLAEVL